MRANTSVSLMVAVAPWISIDVNLVGKDNTQMRLEVLWCGRRVYDFARQFQQPLANLNQMGDGDEYPQSQCIRSDRSRLETFRLITCDPIYLQSKA